MIALVENRKMESIDSHDKNAAEICESLLNDSEAINSFAKLKFQLLTPILWNPSSHE